MRGDMLVVNVRPREGTTMTLRLAAASDAAERTQATAPAVSQVSPRLH
jgi:hypothetical protein